jgi:hypothetical protein
MKDNDSRLRGEIAELARLLPVPAERDLPAGREQRLKQHLMNEFRMASPARPAAARTGRAPERSRRPKPGAVVAAVVAGVLATATAVAAITLSLAARHPAGPSAAGKAQHAAVARLLAKIAVAASHQPSPAVRGNEYEYIKSVEKAIAGPADLTGKPPPAGGKLVTYHIQLWRPTSDICRGFLVRTTPPYPGASPEPARPSYGGPGEKCPSIGDLNRPTYRLLQSLPTNPRRLLNLIYATEKGHGPGPAQEAFTTIGDLLNQSIAPPRVSAALYRAAALIPGVAVVPDAVNAIGQHGVAVALMVDGGGGVRSVLSEWIFDRSTLQMIGLRTVAHGSVTNVTAIVDRAFVDRAGETPPANG